MYDFNDDDDDFNLKILDSGKLQQTLVQKHQFSGIVGS